MKQRRKTTSAVSRLYNTPFLLSCICVAIACGCSPGKPRPDTPHGTMIGHWKQPVLFPVAGSTGYEKLVQSAWEDDNCLHLYISRSSMQPVQRSGDRGSPSRYEVLNENPEAFWLDIRYLQPTEIPRGGIAIKARVRFSDDRQEMHIITRQDTPGQQHPEVVESTNTFRRVDDRTRP